MFKKTALSSAILLACSGQVIGQGLNDQLIIKYKDSFNPQVADLPANMQSLSALAGANLKHSRYMYDGAQIVVLDKNFSDQEIKTIIGNLKQNQQIEYVEEDKLLKPTFTPNDQFYGAQWHYYEATGGINLEAAWDVTTGVGVNIAVLDTGITNHSDLNANVMGGYDMISNTTVANDGGGRDSDPSDPGDWVTANQCGNNPAQDSSWHGTHVAGTVAAVTDNNTGVAGVAFGAKIIPVRVLGTCGGLTSDIADAIVWSSGGNVNGVPANPDPAQVINMSLGGGGSCQNVTQNAINTAVGNGAVIVVASGNSNSDVQNFNPGNCNNVISVAATDRNADRAYYSNFGNLIDIAAPGGDVTVAQGGVASTLNDGTTTPGSETYVYYQGTSMAAPHVAGVAGLMYSVNPSLTPAQVEQEIKNTARAFPGGSDCNTSNCGDGIIDAFAAVNAVNVGQQPILSANNTSIDVCSSQGSSSFSLSLADFGNITNMSLSGCPANANCNFSIDPVISPASSTSLNVTNLGAVAANSYNMTATGTDSVDVNITDDVNLTLNVLADVTTPSLALPADTATGVSTMPTLSWNAVAGATSYDVAVATDANFNNIVDSANGVNGTSYAVGVALNGNTEYFWRVTANNSCGSMASNAFSFTTMNAVCFTTSTAIPDGNASGVTTTLNVADSGSITDLLVSTAVTHTWTGDLIFTLEHEGSGTEVTLMDRPGYDGSGFGCGEVDVNTVFDDSSSNAVESQCSPTPPAIGPDSQPEQALSAFDGLNVSGNWNMTISDNASQDTGTIVSWCLMPTVSAANNPPVADAQNVNTTEDSAVGITLTGSDADGDSLTYSVGNPANGSLSGTAPNLTYTPDANFNGNDSFTFTVNDGTVDSSAATVSINISAANDAPTADSQNVNTSEDNAVGITLTGNDIDGDSLTYAVGNPSNGSLSGTAPNLTYTPDANFNGNDSFTFAVNDGTADSNVATVSIDISAVNDAPTADSQNSSVNEDASVAIVLTGNDIDGDSLSYSVASGPSNGSLSGSAPNLTYTPDSNFNGNDSFTFNVNDGTVGSSAATVSINVNAVNDAPTADSQNVNTSEDSAVGITLTGNDIDGDSLSYSVGNPSNGSLSGTAPNLTYTPDSGYNGNDSFTFTVNDGTVSSSAATVTINVGAVNDAPTADSQNVNTNEDTSIAILLTGSDPDGDSLTYSVGSPSNGVLSGTAPNLGYTPNANFNGADSFTFTVNDGTVDSSLATVTINVSAVEDPTVANGDAYTVLEDVSATTFDVTANDIDVDGDAINISSVGNASNGSTAQNGNMIDYTPDADFCGADSFTYEVNGQASATVNVDVTCVNDQPSITASEQVYVALSDIANPPAQTIACEFVMGPANESGQTANDMVVSITDDGNNVLSSIDVDNAGQLSYTFTGNAGVAEVTVALQDDGGTANAGEDTSMAHTFYVNVQDYIFRDAFEKQACDL